MNTHQLNNISKHESNALQKDLMKNRELNHMVNQRITAYANELDSKSNKTIDEKRRLAQQYQTEISDIYRSIQNRKDNSKEMAKIGMIEKGAERIKANMELQRQLEEMEAFKREEQVKYRHLLDVQVALFLCSFRRRSRRSWTGVG